VSAGVQVHFSSRVFPAALHDLRAVEKLLGFGSEVGAHCATSAGSGSAGQAMRAMAETRVRPFAIVFDSPALDFAARIVERDEDMLVDMPLKN
jgi:hypothetical protein